MNKLIITNWCVLQSYMGKEIILMNWKGQKQWLSNNGFGIYLKLERPIILGNWINGGNL